MTYKALNEPVMNSDDLVYGGYFYVVDGVVRECEFYADDNNSGITVAAAKHRFGVNEIRRCDVVQRQKRADAEKNNRLAADLRIYGLSDPVEDDAADACVKAVDEAVSTFIGDTTTQPLRWQRDGRTIRQSKRRPRCSHKIKKVS